MAPRNAKRRFRASVEAAELMHLSVHELTPLHLLCARFHEYARAMFSPGTARAYTTTLRTLFRDDLAEPVTSLSGEHLEGLVESLKADYAGSTTNKARAAYKALQEWVGKGEKVALPPWPEHIKIDPNAPSKRMQRRRGSPPKKRPKAPDIPDQVALAAWELTHAATRGLVPLEHLLSLAWRDVPTASKGTLRYFMFPTVYEGDHWLIPFGSPEYRYLRILWEHAGGKEFIELQEGRCALVARAPGDPRPVSLFRLRRAIHRAQQQLKDELVQTRKRELEAIAEEAGGVDDGTAGGGAAE